MQMVLIAPSEVKR